MSRAFHHTAISVRNLSESQKFYESLGFEEVHRYVADDNSLVIIQLKIDGAILEIFEYAKNKNIQPLDLQPANNLEQIGVKHFGIKVEDATKTYENMKKDGYEMGSDNVINGRTKIDYFFVKDPDGMWVEIVQDDRGY